MTRVVRDPSEMHRLAVTKRAADRSIVLVPTMGALHRGHVSLLEEGRRHGHWLVLSIFVNPAQFGPQEDLDRYPRDLDGDLKKARAAGVDVAFVPEADAIYPPGFQTFVRVRELERPLCGARRPGHFEGVATVVLKLLNTVLPHVAIFGQKDWQQLQVIRRMVVDLGLEVRVIGMPTVREDDGLALSSRNAYLSPDERQRALAIPQGLEAAGRLHATGERQASRLVEEAAVFLRAADLRVDYLELRDAETLAELSLVDRPAVMAVAAFVGTTRLLDNIVLG